MLLSNEAQLGISIVVPGDLIPSSSNWSHYANHLISFLFSSLPSSPYEFVPLWE